MSEDGDVLSLELLKAQLNTLKSNYTDLHPDVIKLKAQIADLEAKQQAGELHHPATPDENPGQMFPGTRPSSWSRTP